MEQQPVDSLVLCEEILSAEIALQDLESQLNPEDSEDWSAGVAAPVKPRPGLSSGAVALPEP